MFKLVAPVYVQFNLKAEEDFVKDPAGHEAFLKSPSSTTI